jgi:hypothetical protein
MLGRFFNLSSNIVENTPYYMVDAHLNILYTTYIMLKYFFCLSVHVTDKISRNHGMWCWRRMEKISWTDHVRNEEVSLRVNEQRNILHEIRKQKANWIGYILRRKCLPKQVIIGKIKEVTRR